jgi:uncharacterized membrane protein
MTELIGKLHPLVVHLPIGIIVAALLYDWFSTKRGAESPSQALKFLWYAGTISSLVAVICGLSLEQSGHFAGTPFTVHKWTGIALFFFSFLRSLCFLSYFSKVSSAGRLIDYSILILMIVAGHFGGELTHGQGYLLKGLGWISNESKEDLPIQDFSHQDTVLLYEDIVQSIFNRKCVQCHREQDARGGLVLTSYDEVLDDTYGQVIEPRDAHESKLFKRVTAASENEKFMPPSGLPLTFAEIRMIEWWIEEGAGSEVNVRSLEPDASIQAILTDKYNISFKKASFYETVEVDPLDDSLIEDIRSAGFNVSRIAAGSDLLDVSTFGKSSDISISQLTSLAAAKNNVVWLDLSSTNVGDEHLEVIGEMTNLTRLRLQNTGITTVGLQYLAGLEHLSSLNLYGTSIGNEAVNILAQLAALQKVYLWKTDIDDDAMALLKEKLKETEIIVGLL